MWCVERWKILKCRSQKKIVLCRVSIIDTRQRASLPSVAFVHSAKSWRRQAGLTAGQNLPSVRRWHSAKRTSLPSVTGWHSAKRRLCRVSSLSTRQRVALPRVVSLSSVEVWALGKDILCRVPDIKNSAKFVALGKASDSGSDVSPTCWFTKFCFAYIMNHEKNLHFGGT